MGAIRSMKREMLALRGLDRVGARVGVTNPLGTLKSTHGRWAGIATSLERRNVRKSVARIMLEAAIRAFGGRNWRRRAA